MDVKHCPQADGEPSEAQQAFAMLSPIPKLLKSMFGCKLWMCKEEFVEESRRRYFKCIVIF